MVFPLNTILNILDQECQGGILTPPLLRARILKSDVSIRGNHGESLGFDLRAKGLTFHENPFSIAKIQLGLPSYARSHGCLQQPALTCEHGLQNLGECEEGASEGSALCVQNFGHCRHKTKGFGPA